MPLSIPFPTKILVTSFCYYLRLDPHLHPHRWLSHTCIEFSNCTTQLYYFIIYYYRFTYLYLLICIYLSISILIISSLFIFIYHYLYYYTVLLLTHCLSITYLALKECIPRTRRNKCFFSPSSLYPPSYSCSAQLPAYSLYLIRLAGTSSERERERDDGTLIIKWSR